MTAQGLNLSTLVPQKTRASQYKTVVLKQYNTHDCAVVLNISMYYFVRQHLGNIVKCRVRPVLFNMRPKQK